MSLNYTPLRHKMLDEVERGNVGIGDRGEWSFIRWPSTLSQMARACNWAWDLQLIGSYREAGQVQLSDDGRRVLDRWSAQHGDPT